MTHRWMRSAPFDIGLIFGPPLLSTLVALLIPSLRVMDTPVWAWVFFVIFIDVAHVYSSLYRIYLDPQEFSRRRSLYLNVPLACWVVGVMLYRHSALAFWRVLAYVAVFHFVRQQYGFLRIYQYLQSARSRLDDFLDACAIYATMLYPLAFWHADPARKFAWFVQGDFLRLPTAVALASRWFYGVILAVFALRQVQLYAQGNTINWGKIGIVASTAAAWYVGIVYLNSDFAFTVTNVVAHGVPYIALVWLYGNRKFKGTGSWLEFIHRPAMLALFLLPLLGAAYFEEGVWDILVWKEHASVFGGLGFSWELPRAAMNFLVPFLILPQATHYVLDAWIWKLNDSNPGLRSYLFGEELSPQASKSLPAMRAELSRSR